MTAAEFSRRIDQPRNHGAYWTGKCPAHKDITPSLAWRDGDKGLIVKCHAGCAFEAIIGKLGLPVNGFFNDDGVDPRAQRPSAPPRGAVRVPPPAKKSPVDLGTPVSTYPYHAADGTLLFEVARFESVDEEGQKHKTFRPRRLKVKGEGYTFDLKDTPRVLYRLPQLLTKPLVFWTEGEKDVDTLVRLGLDATTTPGGATAFHPDPDPGYAGQAVSSLVKRVVLLPDNDEAGYKYARVAGQALKDAGIPCHILLLPGLEPKGDVSDWVAHGGTAAKLLELARTAPMSEHWKPPEGPSNEPEIQRFGEDCLLTWRDHKVDMLFTAIHEGSETVTAELVVEHLSREVHWTRFNLVSTSAREGLVKRLSYEAPEVPWRTLLERACRLTVLEVRRVAPTVYSTDVVETPTRELVPNFLYEGEPTLIYADGDTGKSLFAAAMTVACSTGIALPHGLRPVRPVMVAYLDWETTEQTVTWRAKLIAAGLGVPLPRFIYKGMKGMPLVKAIKNLVPEFARLNVRLVIIDSMMFAVGSSEHAAYHEPITDFYNALKQFERAASLVLNHVTNADARIPGPSRPYGGAFAFNGPRLIWEAKRDKEAKGAAIVFHATKANNLLSRPPDFSILMQALDVNGEPAQRMQDARSVEISSHDLREVSADALAGLGLLARIKLLLGSGPKTVDALAEELDSTEDVVRKTLNRNRGKWVIQVSGTVPPEWALTSLRST